MSYDIDDDGNKVYNEWGLSEEQRDDYEPDYEEPLEEEE